MVALEFCDEYYKHDTLQIPEEYSDIEVVDISIEKVYLDKPLNMSVFFKMSSWLLRQFELHDNAIFTYICSFDELSRHRTNKTPQEWRWTLFDRLYQRIKRQNDLRLSEIDVIVGPTEYLTFGRAFYRDKHLPVIHIIAAHLRDKQTQYQND